MKCTYSIDGMVHWNGVGATLGTDGNQLQSPSGASWSDVTVQADPTGKAQAKTKGRT